MHRVEYVILLNQADIVIKDKSGKIKHDTRRDRADETKRIAQLSTRFYFADQTARKIIDSFDASVRYTREELIYLFEIWEALKTRFGNDAKARQALSVSRADRSMLTRLANDEPLNQGRHRGQSAGKLRDATLEELFGAQRIARNMINKYLAYLDRNS